MEKPTQYNEVLWYLKKYGTITALEGFTKLYIIDLAGVIRSLRKRFVIEDEWIHKNNIYGRPIRYKRYIYVGEKVELLKNARQ